MNLSAVSTQTRVVIGVAAVLTLALVVRAAGLGEASLWTDELYSVSFAHTPLSDLWSEWMVREPNPPLYYSVLSVWMGLFGETEFAIRFLSVLVSLVGIVGVFLLGRTLRSNGVGLLAALLTALSAHQLQYSQEARAYMLAFAASSFAIVALLRLTDHWRQSRVDVRATWGALALYIVSTSVAVYAHTTLVLLPILANAYVAWFWTFRTERLRDAALAWIGANAIVGLLCAWWFWITFRQLTSGAAPISWIEELSLKDAASRLAHLVGTRTIDGLNFPIALGVGGLMVFGVMRLSIERRVLAAIFGVGIPLLMFVISLVKPVFLERTLLWAQAVYFPCLALGILSLPKPIYRWLAAIVVVIAFSFDSLTWRGGAYYEPWRDVARILREQVRPGDVILVYDADVPTNLSYYERLIGPPSAPYIALQSPPGKAIFPERFTGQVLDAQELPLALKAFDRIFVVQRGENDRFDEDPTDVVAEFATQVAANLLGEAVGAENELRLSVWKLKTDAPA